MKDMRKRSSKDKLFVKMMELIYGQKKAPNMREQRKKISSLRERFTKWKKDENYRSSFGPLQPAFVLSAILHIPVRTIQRVAKEVGLSLPKKISFDEFDISDISEDDALKFLNHLEKSSKPEEEVLSFLMSKERRSPFDYIDLTKTPNKDIPEDFLEHADFGPLKAIAYLQKLIKQYKRNQVHSMTVISLLKNGKVSIWLPDAIDESEIESLYEPIIDLLSNREDYNSNLN